MDKLPTSTPQTTASAASPSPQEAGSHRSCSVCRRRISQLKFDRHKVCSNCRSIVCDINQRCDECKDWSTEDMESYLKHRKSLESKSKKKENKPVENPASSTPTQSKQSLDTDIVRSIESKLSRKMSNLFETLFDNLDSLVDKKINASLSAPSRVPEPAPCGVLGGTSSDSGSRAPQVDRSPGVVPLSNQDPSPTHVMHNLGREFLSGLGSD